MYFSAKGGCAKCKTGPFSRLSPEGTPTPMRSLPPGTAERPYSVFKVTKPFQVKAGEIAPAYGQPGLGTQFVTDQAIRNLISGGYLKRVQP